MNKLPNLLLPMLLVFLPAIEAQPVMPDLDPNEPAGERPYEMVWADRHEPGLPNVRFDQLAGWRLQVAGDAQAALQLSRAQTVWNRPVARLRYHGAGKSEARPSIRLMPPQPVTVPADANAVDVWVYGNRWGWENPPDTPPVRLVLHLRDAHGKTSEVRVGEVRWKEWWLMHHRLPTGLPAPVQFEALEFSGGWQTAEREIYLDSIRFYREDAAPLRFAPRPQRNLALFPGQSPGANTGPGRLPFPTREETILPLRPKAKFKNRVLARGTGLFSFHYEGSDGSVMYLFDPGAGLRWLQTDADGASVGELLSGAGVRLAGGGTNVSAASHVACDGRVVSARYADGTELRLRIWQKSLVIDVINRTGEATDLNFGQITNVTEPRLVTVPYLTYGNGPHPCVLLSRAGTNQVFTSVWLDWYRSNGSEPYAAEAVTTNTARINGGVRYLSRTDGRRNPMFERLFVTVSPVFEEVLPTVPNPVGLHAAEAVDRLWQESWGPDDYERQMKRSRMLRAYGIEKLIQCNHEIAWRDGGESFTLRTRAAPKRGGDGALQRYVAHQRGLGWLAGLYSNYTDYAPVNEFWTPDGVQRLSDGNWRAAWPRCYAEKPLKAVEFDAQLAPQIKRKYQSNSAYTDVHTAVAPWGYNDYDARVPGGGTFAQTFYAYGELLRHDSRVYDGPIFSEGTYQWLYAGLADGNYALAYDGRPPAKEPLLPVFDLLQIHSKECDIGMGWTANFCEAIPDWRKPENLDRAIDRFLLHTLAYGHIGWLVEEEHGLARTARSYYMLQQVQARYGLQRPTRIAYWDGGRLAGVSEAIIRDLPRTRRQLHVEYPGGLRLWLNDHPSENWHVRISAFGLRISDLGIAVPASGSDAIVLPPAGWAAGTTDGRLISVSGLDGTNRFDYLRSAAYTYLDGRGRWFETSEAAVDGALALRPLGRQRLEVIRISGSGRFVVRRPYATRGRCVECAAFDVEGRPLTTRPFTTDPNETGVEPLEKAVRYVLRFSAGR